MKASPPTPGWSVPLARALLSAVCVSFVFPIACGDDAGVVSSPTGGVPGVEGGQGGVSASGSAGKPGAGSNSGASSMGGSAQGGGSSQSGAPTAGGTSEGGAPANAAGAAQGAGAGGESGGAAATGDAGAGGAPVACNDVLENAGCADADGATVDGQSAVFGGCVHINQPSPGVGWVSYQSFGVDIASGLAFVHTADIKGHDQIAAACAAMTVQGISNWRLPTIDEARLLAGGCAPTASGGTCLLSDPGCLGSECGFASPACESCFGNKGPHSSKGYCRPEVPFCLNAATSSPCADCGTVGFWTYGVINGNFYSASANDTMFTICVKDDIPNALPCGL